MKGKTFLVIGLMLIVLIGTLQAAGNADAAAAGAGSAAAGGVLDAGVRLSTTTVALAVGKTATIDAAIVLDTVTDKTLVWSSSSDAIARVDQKGVVTGVKEGFVVITAKTKDGKASGGIKLPVTAAPQAISILTHQGYGVIMVPSNDLPYYKEAQKQMGITVNWTSAPNQNLKEVVATRLAAGVNLPDLINMVNYTYEDVFNQGKNGVIREITDTMYKEFAPGLAEMAKTDPMLRLQRTDSSGRMWSLPDSLTYTKMGQVGFMLNAYWMKDLGLSAPRTLDDLYNVLVAFKTKDPNKNGQADEIPLINLWSTLDFMGDSWDMKLHHTAYGFTHNPATGTVTCDYTSPKMKEYFAYLNKLYANGLLDKEFSSTTMDTLAPKVKAKQMGGIMEWTLFMRLYDSMYDPANVDTSGPCPFPVYKQPVAGPQYKAQRTARDSSTGNWVVTTQSKIPEIGVRLVDTVLTNHKIYDLVTFGIEGQSYKVVNGKKQFIIPMADFNKLAGAEWAFPNKQYGWEDLYWGPRMISDHENNVSITTLTNFPSISGTVEEEATKKKYEADVMGYFQEMRAKFITGDEPIGNFDKYVAEIKKRGADELLKVFQSIYTKYRAMEASLKK